REYPAHFSGRHPLHHRRTGQVQARRRPDPRRDPPSRGALLPAWHVRGLAEGRMVPKTSPSPGDDWPTTRLSPSAAGQRRSHTDLPGTARGSADSCVCSHAIRHLSRRREGIMSEPESNPMTPAERFQPTEHTCILPDSTELFYRAWLPSTPTQQALLLF